jgi:hypothetical protein
MTLGSRTNSLVLLALKTAGVHHFISTIFRQTHSLNYQPEFSEHNLKFTKSANFIKFVKKLQEVLRFVTEGALISVVCSTAFS